MVNMDEFFKAKKTGQSANEASKSDKSRPEGDVAIKRYRNYYDISGTITTAQATDPNDQDNVNYNQEQVFVSLERNAEHITVSNDGVDTLFVIASHEGGQNFSRERPIYPGENKVYFNIYELRLRSPTAGLAYRVTEYPICCVGGVKVLVGQGSATLASLAIATEAMLVDAIDVSNARVLEVQLTCTFNGAATAGATVNLYASIDGTTYDTQNNANTVWVTAINSPVAVGVARTRTSNPIDVSGLKLVMIHVRNEDAAQTLTLITVRYALWK